MKSKCQVSTMLWRKTQNTSQMCQLDNLGLWDPNIFIFGRQRVCGRGVANRCHSSRFFSSSFAGFIFIIRVQILFGNIVKDAKTIICKRLAPPKDHLQKAGSFGWSFARGRCPGWSFAIGRLLQMIICNNNNNMGMGLRGWGGLTRVTGQKEEKKEKEKEEKKFLHSDGRAGTQIKGSTRGPPKVYFWVHQRNFTWIHPKNYWHMVEITRIQ